MYKVLIVDDEPWVAYGISKLVCWESLGFQVCENVYDGIAAASWIQENRPDVVISDIRMPGLDGIELLEKVREQRLNTEVILVSGYSEFEYAQRALQLGAFDYLLKQIEKKMLVETLNRLKKHLDSKRLASIKSEHLLGDLFDLLESDQKAEIGVFYANKQEVLFPHFRVVNAEFSPTTFFDGINSCLQTDGLGQLEVRTGLHKITFLLNYDENNPLAFLQFIDHQLNNATNMGLSSVGCAGDPISRLFHEADVALFTSLFYQEDRIIRYKDNEPLTGASGLLLRLELAIREQKMDIVKDCIRELKEDCIRQQPYVDQVASVYNQIVSIIYKFYGHDEVFQEIDYVSYVQLGRNGSANSLIERIETMIDREVLHDVPIVHGQIKSIMSYIDSHFTEELQLSTIANQFNLSIGYLSYLIKKETGNTYSNYVTTKRIALARELLLDNSLSVQEIVEQVGYKDYFNFNKLFKKHVGLTPSKFRKL